MIIPSGAAAHHFGGGGGCIVFVVVDFGMYDTLRWSLLTKKSWIQQ